MDGWILQLLGLFAISYAAGLLVEKLGLPAVLGCLVAGLGYGATLGPTLHSPDGLQSYSSDLRLAVLSLILLRAGFSISLKDFKDSGSIALKLGTLPLLGDIALATSAAYILFDLTPLTALVLGTVIGAISPAIVIPGLVDLIERHGPGAKRVLKPLLVGAPLDNILAVLLLGVALELALTSNPDVVELAYQVPLSVAGGVSMGLISAAMMARALSKLAPLLSGWPLALALWALATSLIPICRGLGIDMVVAMVTFGATFKARSLSPLQPVEEKLALVWKGGAQYLLFGLIGVAIDIEQLAGAGALLVVVIAAGQLGRGALCGLSLAKSSYTPLERAACAASYVPKATIQAAFAALPLDRGLEAGQLILSAGILAIALTAPAGIILLHKFVDPALRRSEARTSDGAETSSHP